MTLCEGTWLPQCGWLLLWPGVGLLWLSASWALTGLFAGIAAMAGAAGTGLPGLVAAAEIFAMQVGNALAVLCLACLMGQPHARSRTPRATPRSSLDFNPRLPAGEP